MSRTELRLDLVRMPFEGYSALKFNFGALFGEPIASAKDGDDEKKDDLKI